MEVQDFNNQGFQSIYYGSGGSNIDGIIVYKGTVTSSSAMARDANVKICRYSGTACCNTTLSPWQAWQTGSATLQSSTCSNPVPVFFSQYKAIQSENKVQVLWSTTQEIDVINFEVERSYDGFRFEKVAELEAIGKGGLGASYIIADEEAIIGEEIYYRIIVNEKYEKYEITPVFCLGDHFILTSHKSNLFPNPSNGNELFFRAYSDEHTPFEIEFFDLSGHLLHTYTLSSTLHGMVYPINISELNLKSGIFLVEIQTYNSPRHTERLEVEIRE